MKKIVIIGLPVLALMASCGQSGVDQNLLNAKVDALVKNAQNDAKTVCDAMVVQTSQMRADSIRAINNAAAAVVPAAPVVPAEAATPAKAAATTKVPAKTPTKVVTPPAKPKTEGEKVTGLFDKKEAAKKTETEKKAVQNIFNNDKKAVEKKAATEKKNVQQIFENKGEKTKQEIKKEEDKVKGLFNK